MEKPEETDLIEAGATVVSGDPLVNRPQVINIEHATIQTYVENSGVAFTGTTAETITIGNITVNQERKGKAGAR